MSPVTALRYRERVFAERDRLRRRCADVRTAHQRAVLADLLAHNADTEFGREHGFDRIRTTRRLPRGGAHPGLRRARAVDRPGGRRRARRAVRRRPGRVLHQQRQHGRRQEDPGHPRVHAHELLPVLLRGWAPFAEHFPDVLADAGRGAQPQARPGAAVATTASGRPHLGASQVDFGAAFGEPLSAEPGTAAPWATCPCRSPPDDHLEKAYLRLRLRGGARRAVRHRHQPGDGRRAALPAAAVVAADRQGDPRRHARRPPYGSPDPERAAELERLADAVRRAAAGARVAEPAGAVLLDHRAGLAVPAAPARGVRRRGDRAARPGGRLRGPGRRSPLDRHARPAAWS